MNYKFSPSTAEEVVSDRGECSDWCGGHGTRHRPLGEWFEAVLFRCLM